MDYSTIRYEVDGDGVLLLTLSRPEKLNAFTVTMCEELVHAYRRASQDDTVRAVVVTGAGRAFCAGMDLSREGNVFGLDEALKPTPETLRDRLDDPAWVSGVRDTGGRVALAMYDCRKPIIGAVNGAAVGIGSTMLLPMDFRFAAPEARFGFVFGKLGITLEACSSWFLPRIVGMEQALEWAYRAEIFGADEALAGKLIRRIVPADRLVDEAKAFALSLVRDRSPVATALMRQMLYRNSSHPHPLEAHLAESLAVFYTSQADGKEGVQAFLQKRAPKFTAVASAAPTIFPQEDAGG